MRNKRIIYAAAAVTALFGAILPCAAVDTTQIQRVRNKSVLEQSDLQVIDTFVKDAITELAQTSDFSSIAALRGTIVSMSRSQRAQYRQQFIESAQNYIAAGFNLANRLQPNRQVKVRMNLLILIDALGDVELLDMAVQMLQDPRSVVQYWATHCVANPEMLSKLNSGGTANSQIARAAAEAMKQAADKADAQVLGLMAQYGGGIRIPQGEELLLKVADLRIRSYATWTVEEELIDAKILMLLADRIAASTSSVSKASLGNRFGQLLAYVMERYVKGEQVLSPQQKRDLASVMVEVEDKSIGKLLGTPRSGIRRAIERQDLSAIQQEYNALFGSESNPGLLASKLNVKYGTAGGVKRASPFPLPAPKAAQQ